MLNKVILIGRLGRDPETKTTMSGQTVCNFTMATSEKWRDKTSGEMQEKTEWHRIVVWGKPGETVGKYARKGSLIYIEGKIRYGSYSDKDGVKRTTVEIHADEFHFLSSKTESVDNKPARREPEDIPF